MAHKNPERTAATRRRIMDAYWDIYTTDPARTVTASAVIEVAGIHRSTFYQYFPDAPAVLVAIEDELAEMFGAEAARALASGGEDPAGIVQRVYVEHGDRLSVLLGDGGDPAFARRLKDALAPLAELGLAPADEVFSPYLFEFAASGILAAATLWYERGRDLEPAEFGAGMRAALAGLANSVRPLE